MLKTPLTYYGGKQRMLRLILPLIPEHTLYAEPFCGGAAVFFAKEPSPIEVINDNNRLLINFYRVVRNRFGALQKKVEATLHARSLHRDARTVYENPHLFDEIEQAWAVFTLSAESFSSMLDGTFGYDKSSNTTSKKISRKTEQFRDEISNRLKNVQIECTDAIRVIKSRDTAHSFFYVDPPYFNSDCGHYDGYTIEDFELLLKALSAIKGRFLLSSYPSELLSRYTLGKGWHTQRHESTVSVAAKNGNAKKKTEVLTANYTI